MEDDGEEVAYMSEEELRKVYRKLFAMRPYMTIGKFTSISAYMSLV